MRHLRSGRSGSRRGRRGNSRRRHRRGRRSCIFKSVLIGLCQDRHAPAPAGGAAAAAAAAAAPASAPAAGGAPVPRDVRTDSTVSGMTASAYLLPSSARQKQHSCLLAPSLRLHREPSWLAEALPLSVCHEQMPWDQQEALLHLQTLHQHLLWGGASASSSSCSGSFSGFQTEERRTSSLERCSPESSSAAEAGAAGLAALMAKCSAKFRSGTLVSALTDFLPLLLCLRRQRSVRKEGWRTLAFSSLQELVPQMMCGASSAREPYKDPLLTTMWSVKSINSTEVSIVLFGQTLRQAKRHKLLGRLRPTQSSSTTV